MTSRSIAIFGGTFDPIHYGHLRSALSLMSDFAIDEVRFIPSALPPHRDCPAVSAEQRLAMVDLAVAGQPGFVIDDQELHRQGPSFAVDTLEAIKQEQPSSKLQLIMGMDAFEHFLQWHRWSRILELANLLIIHRPGSQLPTGEKIAALLAERQQPIKKGLLQANGAIVIAEVTPLDISATKIRNALKCGKSPRYLLPDAVIKFIEENQLYR